MKMKTENGSIVTIKDGRVTSVDLNWFDEGGCPECYPEFSPGTHPELILQCDYCPGGSALLTTERT